MAGGDGGRTRVTPPRWVAWLVAALVGLAVLAALLTTMVPESAVPDHLSKAGYRELSAKSDVRNTIIQAIAGFVILIGLCFTAWSLHISRETHLTDRLAKAVDQLGHDEPTVRLGGVYSLQRLARNSRADNTMVADLLTGYLQINAGANLNPSPLDKIDPDIQIALTVLVELQQ